MLKPSIIICTYKRAKKLKKCLESILNQKNKYIEVLVIDQNNSSQVKGIIKKINNPLIKYFNIQKTGLSVARNYGINLAKGEILIFIDDDCIVSNSWLANIIISFNKNSEVAGLFGRVLPFKPKKNKDKICPCTFISTTGRLINKPCIHWQNIGFGNNMAFRKEIFAKVGSFKEWLGIGSVSKSAEDAEFALRCLLKGYKLLYGPKVVVYHNKWLTKDQFQQQKLSYLCGEIACYGYFSFGGQEFAKEVVKMNFKKFFINLLMAMKLSLLFKKGSMWKLKHELFGLLFRLRGLLLAWYFSQKEPFND